MFEPLQLLFIIGVAVTLLSVGVFLFWSGFRYQPIGLRVLGICFGALGALVGYWAWKFPGIVDRDHQREAEERAKQEMHATPAP